MKERKDLTLSYWRENVDKLLSFNDKPILNNTGSISHAQMEEKVNALYDEFHARRQSEKVSAAEGKDLEELAQLSKKIDQAPSSA